MRTASILKPHHGLAFLAAALILSLATACTDSGDFDGGVEPDPEPNATPTITAADIGTRCVYNPTTGENPSNDCAPGLTCLIVTRDLAYAPYAFGDQRNLSLPLWENHFTYYRADGNDEGYCTLVATQTAGVQTCPVGTTNKALWSNMQACVKNCTQALDCNREGFACDLRFIDISSVGGNHCVRKCTNDEPDCVRTGWFTDPQTQQARPMVAIQDLLGASSCNLESGICQFRQEFGNAGPGERCYSNADCQDEMICLNGPMIGQPDQTGGACGQPCIPHPQPQTAADLQSTCTSGNVCQAGITGGLSPYTVIDLDNGQTNNLGGYCFPQCALNTSNCAAYEGTACGQINEAVFGQGWNGVSMCLVPELRQGL